MIRLNKKISFNFYRKQLSRLRLCYHFHSELKFVFQVGQQLQHSQGRLLPDFGSLLNKLQEEYQTAIKLDTNTNLIFVYKQFF